MAMKKLDILYALITILAWGSNYVAISFAVSELPGFLAMGVRLAITAAMLLPFVSKPQIPFKDLYKSSLAFGVFFLGLLYYGMFLGLNSSLSILIMQLNIPISVGIGRLLLNEKFTSASIIGMVISLGGVVIVLGAPQLNNSYFPVLVVLCAAFSCAYFNVKSRYYRNVPALSLVCWASLISAPHLFLISYFIEGNPLPFILSTSYITWTSILYSVFIASLLCQGLWISLLQKYPLYKILPYNLLVPFIGVSLSMICLGDRLTFHLIVGGIVTIIGVIISQMNHLIPSRE
jgi:O-acetylserine/cysteine efflux transporter